METKSNASTPDYEPLRKDVMVERIEALIRKTEHTIMMGHDSIEEAIFALADYHHEREGCYRRLMPED